MDFHVELNISMVAPGHWGVGGVISVDDLGAILVPSPVLWTASCDKNMLLVSENPPEGVLHVAGTWRAGDLCRPVGRFSWRTE
jgi:hypothetical protein